MINAIKCDLEKSLLGFSSVAAALLTFALCLTESVYMSTEGRAYSVLEALLHFERGFMESSDSFCSLLILKNALSGYSAMFLPILAAFPFVNAYCSEFNSGNARFAVFRSKRLCCYISKFLCAVLCGGVCVAAGVILFGVFTFAAFPHTSYYPPETMRFFFPDGAAAEFFKKALSAFLYGAASALPAFFLSSFCRNRYIILCVPFLARFMQDTAIKKIIVNAHDNNLYQRVFPFQCHAPSQIPYLKAGSTLCSTIAVAAISAALMLFGYIIVMERRTDKGD